MREGGPYAVRADIRLDGAPAGNYRATLCRCGASKNKPFCDGSHHEVNFAASGEPPTGKADMLPVRDGPLAVDPQTDGPLQVRGNLEIISGTGRVVARLESARLCRCGASNTKPFCDGTTRAIGFQSVGTVRRLSGGSGARGSRPSMLARPHTVDGKTICDRRQPSRAFLVEHAAISAESS